MKHHDLQRQIDRLFDAAIRLPPSGRAEFLDRNCAGLPLSVRSDVDALIEMDQHLSDDDAPFLADATISVASMLQPPAASEKMAGEKIGPYEVVKQIAVGGFGTVYLCVRNDEFQQQVAIKLMRSDIGDHEVIKQRFSLERQVLSDLDHPNIARLLDGGSLMDGRPYFVMEFVDGQEITDYCDTHKLTIDDRLRLFQKVCGSVSHAHQYEIVHRDIKPTNILVTRNGVPKLLDFGIAKLVDPRSQRRQPAVTKAGQLPMTPEYASPEQMLGKPVGQFSDIYSLGIVLYEMLTGVRPFQVEGRPHHEFARVVCEAEPSKPSASLTTGNLPADTIANRNLRKKLTGDLDNIVLMALRKEPERRYSSVNHFSEDIQRYFDGLPVTARTDSLSYRMTKFIRRNRVYVLTSVAILVGVFAAWLHASMLTHELQRNLYCLEIKGAYDEWHAGNLNRVRSVLDAQLPRRNGRDLRGFEWRYLDHLYANNQSHALTFGSPILAAASHKKGESVAVLVNGMIVSVEFKTRKQTVLRRVEGDENRRVHQMRFDDMGNTLALVSNGADSDELEIVRLPTNQSTRVTTTTAGRISKIDFSPNGRWLAIGDEQGRLTIRDAQSGDSVWATKEDELSDCTGLSFAPDGQSIAVVTLSDRSLTTWSWNRDEFERAEKSSISLDVELLLATAYSPDGKQVAVGGSRLTVARIDDRKLESSVLPFDIVQYVQSVAFSSRGDRIAIGTASKFVEVRNAKTFELIFRKPQGEKISHVFFSADDQTVVTISQNRIYLWEVSEGNPSWSTDGAGAAMSDAADVSSDGHFVAFADDRDVVTWDLDEDVKSRRTGMPNRVTDVSFAGNKLGFLGATDRGGNVVIWKLNNDVLPRQPIKIIDGDLRTLDLSPTNQLFAVGGDDHVSLWTYGGTQIWSDEDPGIKCMAVGFSQNGKLMMTSGTNASPPFEFEGAGFIRIWDVSTQFPKRIREFDTPGLTMTLAVSPDNSMLAAGHINNAISLIDLRSMTLRATMSGHASGIATLGFHPDGTRLVSGGWDGDIKFWDVRSALEVGTIKYGRAISAIRFVSNADRGFGLYVSSDENGQRNRVEWLGLEAIEP